jgi:hypothetical protein
MAGTHEFEAAETGCSQGKMAGRGHWPRATQRPLAATLTGTSWGDDDVGMGTGATKNPGGRQALQHGHRLSSRAVSLGVG